MPIVRVREVVKETSDAHTLVLESGEGERVDYVPGQFLTIRIPSDRPEGAARCYSLCTAPGHDEFPAVTVKRTDGGYASNWLCDHAGVGTELEVLAPSGIFTPASLDEDLLLLAGGSGITPVMSILKTLLHSGTGSAVLLYGNRDEHSVIFAEQLRELVARFPERLRVVHWLETVQGLPSQASLGALLRGFWDHDATAPEAFVCGPAPFMDLAERTLLGLGVPERRVHMERFTSLEGDPFAAPAAIDDAGPASEVEVTLNGETRVLAWPESNNLVDVMLAAGMEAPYSCREGACSACACIVLDGEVSMDRNEVLDDADLADGLVLGCQARPRSPRIRLSYDG
ncbi:ferredoxin--NADP reductase [Nocardioides sp. zg-DK7169]|uniref:ferredoxin--NADP reductase n=1 Tax=Nocardioides sp. zg-DK7169 TaxID=2736600 RepID=UPI0015520F68|nr:ferredoxin--NADP reductase [Nocardioides sp. zg-DK7169]NPC98672.1 ferredoxin--NADP reductase [Nocardioides sp. zg-DK7169]